MNIYIDLDNTTIDSAPSILKDINERNSTHFKLDDVNEWNAILNEDEISINYAKELYKSFDTPGFLENLEPMNGAIKGIEFLKSEGHNLSFLTSRREKYKSSTEKWVDKYFSDINVIYASGGKDEYADKFDILLDDSADEIKSVISTGKTGIIYDRPWNRTSVSKNCKRVYCWEQFLDLMTPKFGI